MNAETEEYTSDTQDENYRCRILCHALIRYLEDHDFDVMEFSGVAKDERQRALLDWCAENLPRWEERGSKTVTSTVSSAMAEHFGREYDEKLSLPEYDRLRREMAEANTLREIRSVERDLHKLTMYPETEDQYTALMNEIGTRESLIRDVEARLKAEKPPAEEPYVTREEEARATELYEEARRLGIPEAGRTVAEPRIRYRTGVEPSEFQVRFYPTLMTAEGWKDNVYVAYREGEKIGEWKEKPDWRAIQEKWRER